jgi:hypothetical protein
VNQPRPALDALRDALAAEQPTSARQDALHLDALTSRPALEALAGYAERLLAATQLDRGAQAATIGVERLGQLASLARAAAVHGYPRPALEQLGRDADRLPSARTADPSTSHDARPPVPRRGNMLAKLLVGFLAWERQESDRAVSKVDATLTSEELAKRLDVEHTEYAKRCSDLLALGYIRVARDDDGHERTRRGDSGRQRLVFELTDDGRRKAQELGAGR